MSCRLLNIIAQFVMIGLQTGTCRAIVLLQMRYWQNATSYQFEDPREAIRWSWSALVRVFSMRLSSRPILHHCCLGVDRLRHLVYYLLRIYSFWEERGALNRT